MKSVKKLKVGDKVRILSLPDSITSIKVGDVVVVTGSDSDLVNFQVNEQSFSFCEERLLKLKEEPIKIEENMPVIPNTFRRFEYKVYPSNKFWEIWKEDLNSQSSWYTYSVRYGKIGVDGRTVTKNFNNLWERDDAYNRIIYQKINKGYIENKQTKELAVKVEKKEIETIAAKLEALPPIKKETKAEREEKERLVLEEKERKTRILRFPGELE